MDSSIRSLVEQINGAVPGSGDAESEDDDHDYEEEVITVDDGASLRAELDRLRQATEAKPVAEAFTYDQDAPALVPVGVPQLPNDFQRTDATDRLLQNLLHSSTPTKVGFWGMGGIGKTVTGAAIARDADVRNHFDQIIWLPLGQTPVTEKLQSSALEQLIGKQMEPNVSQEERQAVLRDAFKGKRVLLALDDLWEEEHQHELSFVDVSMGSRVLISTRIRDLLSDAFSVEIGKPSVDDSVQILMGASKLTGRQVPSEATEIVELCGRLPLALVMAGKLILELEMGDNWDGITSILRDELRGDQQASSREQAVIRASLAGLKGSARDQTGAQNLFKLFGLVPEDTSCPLECLQMLYDAVYETSKATSILHIRKWLKVLIGRSLVLGTVDRASLHDLVLDFTKAMHTKAELIGAHRRVVEAFRSNRPSNAYGLKLWDKMNHGDPLTAYCIDESEHHIKCSRDSLSTDEVLLSWLMDQPPDALCDCVSNVLGEDVIVRSAEAAEAAGKMWPAACRWNASAHVAWHTRGPATQVAHLKRAAVAVTKARGTKPGSSRSLEMDHLELMVAKLLGMYDVTNQGENLSRLKRLVATDAGKARPDQHFNYWITEWTRPWFTGDAQGVKDWSDRFLSFKIDVCENSPDLAMREVFKQCLAWNTFWAIEAFTLVPGFDWSIYGVEGEHCSTATRGFDYAQHHFKVQECINMDFAMTMGSAPVVLGLHYGDLNSIDVAFETMLQVSKRVLREPKQEAEYFGRLAMVAMFWPVLFGKATEFASVLADHVGTSWPEVEQRYDMMVAGSPWFAPRGQHRLAGTSYLLSGETQCWCIKLNLALCTAGESAVTKEQMQTIPSPHELSQYSRLAGHQIANGKESCITHCAISPHLLAAQALESYGMDDEALKFVNVIHDLDPNLGGDPKVTSHILAYCIKGRILARRGQAQAAAAAFEAAVAQSEELELWLLTVFALRDLKLFVLDHGEHGEHGARRLGLALRRLKDPADRFLNGMGAGELMALPPPDAAYAFEYPQEESTEEATLRQEYGGLRLKDLRTCAREAGMPADMIEQAMDSDTPEEELITYLIEQQSAEADAYAIESALMSELQGLRLKDLRKRAKDCGVAAEVLEGAMDDDSPEGAVIGLVLAATRASSDDSTGGKEHHLRAQLQGLRLKGLRKRAKADGVDATDLDEAMDDDEPEATLIDLILTMHALSKSSRDISSERQALIAELQSLRLKELRKRAKGTSISADQLDDTMDTDDPKAALIALLLAVPPAKARQADKSHFGTKQATQ